MWPKFFVKIKLLFDVIVQHLFDNVKGFESKIRKFVRFFVFTPPFLAAAA